MGSGRLRPASGGHNFCALRRTTVSGNAVAQHLRSVTVRNGPRTAPPPSRSRALRLPLVGFGTRADSDQEVSRQTLGTRTNEVPQADAGLAPNPLAGLVASLRPHPFDPSRVLIAVRVLRRSRVTLQVAIREIGASGPETHQVPILRDQSAHEHDQSAQTG